jgi:hypothetical protein
MRCDGKSFGPSLEGENESGHCRSLIYSVLIFDIEEDHVASASASSINSVCVSLEEAAGPLIVAAFQALQGQRQKQGG